MTPENPEQPAAPPAEPTPEQAAAVSTAAGTAVGESIQGGETPEQARERANTAIREKAEQIDFKMSEEDRTAIVDELIDRMQALGAFDPPPPPEQPAAPPPPAAEQPANPAAPEQPAAPPRKKTFAERFAGQ